MRAAFAASQVLAKMRDRRPAQVRLKTCTPSPPHARRERPQCRKRRCRDRDRGRRAGKPRNLPASRDRSRRRPAPGELHDGDSSPAILSASATKISFVGATAASGRKAVSSAPTVAVGPADRETELVFCRMTSICQAISCSSKLRTRARARSRPDVASVRTEMPVASPISFPSLGDTKCGTFNAMRAAVRPAATARQDRNLSPNPPAWRGSPLARTRSRRRPWSDDLSGAAAACSRTGWGE